VLAALISFPTTAKQRVVHLLPLLDSAIHVGLEATISNSIIKTKKVKAT
jgi:hypothetical protein